MGLFVANGRFQNKSEISDPIMLLWFLSDFLSYFFGFNLNFSLESSKLDKNLDSCWNSKKTWVCNELRQSRAMMRHNFNSDSSPSSKKKSSHNKLSKNYFYWINKHFSIKSSLQNNLIQPLWSMNHFWLVHFLKPQSVKMSTLRRIL